MGIASSERLLGRLRLAPRPVEAERVEGAKPAVEAPDLLGAGVEGLDGRDLARAIRFAQLERRQPREIGHGLGIASLAGGSAAAPPPARSRRMVLRRTAASIALVCGTSIPRRSAISITAPVRQSISSGLPSS